MNSRLALSIFTVLTLKEVIGECDDVAKNYTFGEKEVLMAGLYYPYQMAVDYSLNILYISIGDYPEGRTAELDLTTKILRIIEDVPAGFAQAVDQNTHNVYIGGSKGLFKYDPITKKIKHIVAEGVQSVYFKDLLYYFTSGNKAFVLKKIPQPLYGFGKITGNRIAVDKDDDVIFCDSEYSLYRQKLGTEDAIFIEKFDNWCTVATDKFGKAFVTKKDGIYSINKSNNTLVKAVNVDRPYTVTFDANNSLIYADDHTIYRLKVDTQETC